MEMIIGLAIVVGGIGVWKYDNKERKEKAMKIQ